MMGYMAQQMDSLIEGSISLNEELSIENEKLKLRINELENRINARWHNEQKWHSPGMGEVHSHDHLFMIDCMIECNQEEHGQDYLMSDEFADLVCDAMNALQEIK